VFSGLRVWNGFRAYLGACHRFVPNSWGVCVCKLRAFPASVDAGELSCHGCGLVAPLTTGHFAATNTALTDLPHVYNRDGTGVVTKVAHNVPQAIPHGPAETAVGAVHTITESFAPPFFLVRWGDSNVKTDGGGNLFVGLLQLQGLKTEVYAPLKKWYASHADCKVWSAWVACCVLRQAALVLFQAKYHLEAWLA
jgi:hypothetical protein